MTRLVALDCETELIATGKANPKLICMTLSWRGKDGRIQRGAWGNHPEELPKLEQTLRKVLEHPETMLVGANIPFDVLVLSDQFPDLWPLFLKVYERLGVHDVQIADRLIALSTSGETDMAVLPDGSRKAIKANLAELSYRYLGRNRFGEKADGWRLRFSELDGMRFREYPIEARSYVIEDSDDPLLIAEIQRDKHAPGKQRSTCSGVERYSMLALWGRVCSVHGMQINHERMAEVDAMVSEIRDIKNLPHLVDAGYLIPAQPPRPYANGATNKETGEPLMTQPKAEKIRQGAIKRYIAMQSWEVGVSIRLTDTGELFFGKDQLTPDEVQIYLKKNEDRVIEKLASKELPIIGKKRDKNAPTSWREVIKKEHGLDEYELQLCEWCAEKSLPFHAFYHLCDYVSTSADAIQAVSVITEDPILQEFQSRQEVDKLATTLLPNVSRAFSEDAAEMGVWGVVHPSFEVPKSTGRMSSRIDKTVPSIPIHQMPGKISKIDPRLMVEARPGYVLIDRDVNALELRTTGHVTATMFEDAGSVPCMHAQLIREGVDLHSYLGAQIALRTDPDVSDYIRQTASSEDPRAQWEAFCTLKGTDLKQFEGTFKHFRTLAKPTGLGYIGGLGPKTFVDFAAGTYGVKVTMETARMLRDQIWAPTYPEVPKAFKLIQNTYKDKLTPRPEGSDYEFYQYTNPWGAVRVGAFYTATMNGVMMQSPGAAVFNQWFIAVSRECHNPELESVLYGSRVIVPLHDQLLVECPCYDWEHVRACSDRIEQLLIEAGERYCPRVPWKGEGGFALNWSKQIEPVFNDAGELIIWDPTGNHHDNLPEFRYAA